MENQEYISQNVGEQLQKLENDAEMTSASDFAMAQNWEKWNTILGLSIVLISGYVASIGAASSFKYGSTDWTDIFKISSAVAGALTAILGSVLTFLKPSERASRYREFGNKQKSLRNRIRLYRTVSIHLEQDVVARCSQLGNFLTEKDALNSDNPPITKWAFVQATRDIADKEKRKKQRE
jgi:hypothetical protein